jgi:alanyl-tRNA synthetase
MSKPIMTKNNLDWIVGKIRDHYSKENVPEIEKTNVVSPLFPGQFNYCLDEVNLLEKYGDLVNIGEEHFQKIQPAIRLSDYHQLGVSGDHLGRFTIGTTRGFHSPISGNGEKEYDLAVKSLLSFFDELGLDKQRLSITYFSGNYAKDVEALGKRDSLEQDLKVQVDKYLSEDEVAIPVWTENGLEEDQLVAGNTRDNFLTSAWYVALAPWGYRNEIFYEMPDGRDLDIATIERLTMYPEVERKRDSQNRSEPYVVDIHDWDIGAMIDGFGIERTLLAVEGKDKIYDLDFFSPLNKLKISNEKIEALRILHRIYTDSSWEGLRSRGRKNKTKNLMRSVLDLDVGEMKEILEINSEMYASLFPDLKEGIENTLEEIHNYRGRVR